MMSKSWAPVLRALAESANPHDFSCNMVERALGSAARKAYEQLYELASVRSPDGPWYEAPANARDLWSLMPEDVARQRAVMLDFAAAMAETGDL
jgi:hypothetical protein